MPQISTTDTYACITLKFYIFLNHELQDEHQTINVGWCLIPNDGGDNFIHTHNCIHIHDAF